MVSAREAIDDFERELAQEDDRTVVEYRRRHDEHRIVLDLLRRLDDMCVEHLSTDDMAWMLGLKMQDVIRTWLT